MMASCNFNMLSYNTKNTCHDSTQQMPKAPKNGFTEWIASPSKQHFPPDGEQLHHTWDIMGVLWILQFTPQQSHLSSALARCKQTAATAASFGQQSFPTSVWLLQHDRMGLWSWLLRLTLSVADHGCGPIRKQLLNVSSRKSWWRPCRILLISCSKILHDM